MSDLPIVTHDMEVLSLINITTCIPMAAPYGLGDPRMGSLSPKNMWFQTPLNGSYFDTRDWAYISSTYSETMRCTFSRVTIAKM